MALSKVTVNRKRPERERPIIDFKVLFATHILKVSLSINVLAFVQYTFF